jgi:hypothetical protein
MTIAVLLGELFLSILRRCTNRVLTNYCAPIPTIATLGGCAPGTDNEPGADSLVRLRSSSIRIRADRLRGGPKSRSRDSRAQRERPRPTGESTYNDAIAMTAAIKYLTGDRAATMSKRRALR